MPKHPKKLDRQLRGYRIQQTKACRINVFCCPVILIASLLPILSAGSLAAAPAGVLPRTVLAIYDSHDEAEIHQTRIHRWAEMPLNHLGLVVCYQDIRSGLPPLSEMQEVRGVLTWFLSDAVPEPSAYLKWAEAVVDSGKQFVILGQMGIPRAGEKQVTTLREMNHFLAKLGLRLEGGWSPITYDAQLVFKDPKMVEFERPLAGPLPTFDQMKVVDSRAKSFLVARRGNDPKTDSHLVVSSPAGGFVASGYTHYAVSDPLHIQWYMNPFEFFRTAFATETLPKPDTTTLSGRLIFYSHLDGDGWRSESQIGSYQKSRSIAAEVVLKEILQAFPDLPVTVAPIAADIDPKWHGSAASLQLAKNILALPHVEAASHTYSHPLDWRFFSRDSRDRKGSAIHRDPIEAGVSPAQQPAWRSFLESLLPASNSRRNESAATATAKPDENRTIPRSYGVQPFRLDEEILGSIAFVNTLLPSGKRVELVEWSGDTLPFEYAMAATKKAGVRNLNGGSTLFDQDHFSHAWVAPIGRQVGAHHQIYASNGNENTYSDLWAGRYFSFSHWVKSLLFTETPRRLKPLSVYYHMYAGEKLSSLNAVLECLRYAQKQETVPVTAGHFARIADGFFSTRITQLGQRVWQIENRDSLQTLRFDQGTSLAVDFAHSKGVIGQRHYQDSLYVALDEADAAPIVALREHTAKTESPAAHRPYLIQGRWQVWNLQAKGHKFTFIAQGFGTGEMIWRVPAGGRFEIQTRESGGDEGKSEVVADQDGILRLALSVPATSGVEIRVSQISALP